jgi:hypothetical protein|tara:strand:- start:126 stop:401 length:276 start_codon:yes stop_codon:yes gene_type:complete
MTKQQQHKVQAEILKAYRDIFLHTPQGDVILRDMMKACGLYAMTGVRPDSELQHMEGGRDMVRRIIAILALDEEQITNIALGEVGEISDVE